MAFIPAVNTVMASIRMTQQGENTENTLYFERSGTVTIPDMNALATALVTWWGNVYAPSLPTSTQLREVYVVDMSSAIAPTATAVPAAPSAGDIVADALPNNSSIAVSFRTANRGRSFRGRNYVPGLVETEVTNNRLADARVTAIVNAYNSLNVTMFGLGWQHAVVSRYTNGLERTLAEVTPVTQYLITDTVIDSQRRRLPGRGR